MSAMKKRPKRRPKSEFIHQFLVALTGTDPLVPAVGWTVFDDEDAREAGTVRAELELVEKPIGAYDVLIAGQARRRGATLVTSNAREFDRVAGLKWEDWSVSRR
jgi:predicted nucleic acid-binding protein